jgi:hypothetical protein
LFLLLSNWLRIYCLGRRCQVAATEYRVAATTCSSWRILAQ